MPHSYTVLYTHVVFSTKDRTPQIPTSLEERLYSYLGGILRDLNGRLLHVNGAEDHIHILISSPPTASLAELVGKVKGCSSKWIHETFSKRAKFAWQRGYGAFSVSQSQLPTVARYIARQKAHHAKTSFQDEFVRLLSRHGIQVDEQFLWT
jgi:REP element-mobilizing transposase RayT